MWNRCFPTIVTIKSMHYIIIYIHIMHYVSLALSLSLSPSSSSPTVHSCTTTDTLFLSDSLSSLCLLSFPLSVLLLQFFCAEGYSSFFYKLFVSFTISIIHLHTPSFLIIFFTISLITICTCPFPSISLWTLSSFHPGLISTSLPVCSFVFMLFC